MNVVDSSGWLEYFAEAPNASFFAAPIQNVAELLVPAITIFEVFKHVLLQRGEQQALEAVAVMMQGQLIALDATIAVNAARLSCELKLPMADSIILVTAQMSEALLWTQDADFAAVQGVRYTPKPLTE